MTNSPKADLKNIPIDLVVKNPENPRIFFRQEEMEQLYASIKNKGLLQPIAVYRDKDKYVILDGERRWRTFLKLNYSTIPAIIQEKPSPLENLLLMFNIHSNREQWDIFTIAMKIERVSHLLKSKLRAEPTEQQLSSETGTSRGVIRRCKTIIALPERFKDLIRAELEKPKKDQIYSEDFFLEMENSLKTVSKNYPNTVKNIDKVRDVLIKKYTNKVINNVVDFRKLTKIATAWKNVGFPKQKAETAITNLFLDNNISIDSVYKDTIETLYVDKKVINHANNFLTKLDNITVSDLDDPSLKKTLLKIRNKINNLLEE